MRKPFRPGGRGLLAAAVILLLAGGTTACSAPGGGEDAGRATTSGRNGGAPTTSTTSAGFAEAVRGLSRVASSTGPIICSVNDGGWEAAAFDDTLHTKIATFSERALQTQLTEIAQEVQGAKAFVPSLCGDEGEAGVSPISPDGQRVAIQVNLSDGGTQKQVGWFDLRTGKFTNITKSSEKTGYSTESFSDETPGFAPDGSFWFLRDSQEFLSADENGRLTPHQLSLACFRRSNEEGFYRPVRSVAVMCPQTIHPSGRFAASATHVGVGFTMVDGFELEVLAPKVGRFSDAPNRSPLKNQVIVRDHGRLRGCRPVAWINSNDLLCSGPRNDFYTVQVDPATARSDLDYVHTIEVRVKAEIARETESKIVSIALSRDRDSLIIASSKDGQVSETKIYRASLTSPGDPVELGPVPEGVGGDLTFLGNFQKSDW